MSKSNDDSEDSLVEMWKIKKLILNLSQAKGAGTSMISLIIPPKDQISRVNKMLGDEYGTASNIKSRVNKLSVLSAITATQQRLKLYNKVPPNGLVVYCGTIMTNDNKEKKVTFDFEPFKKINTSLYLCDNKFHVEPLMDLLKSNDTFGFIIMDGHGTLFATLTGATKEILHKVSVMLPKKHGRGGQSAVRFARLRLEKRHNYVRKVAELANKLFIKDGLLPNVTGLILAGSADFKKVLGASDIFDHRLVPIIMKYVDVSYGGQQGFNQAIELSKDVLGNVKFIREKKLIDRFMKQIATDSGKYTFGVDQTIKCMEMGAIKTLIVYEDLNVTRFVLTHPVTEEKHEVYLRPNQEKDKKYFYDKETGAKYNIEQEPFLEWLANTYKKFGCSLEFVTNKSPEGAQFVSGFGGIGGLLRYRVDIDYDDFEEYHSDSDDSDKESGSDESDSDGDDLDDFM